MRCHGWLSPVPSIWLLLLLSLALWGGECLRRDLWEPDEARVGYVAREMAQDGHWLVPHRHGEYYAHKPPLLYWLINLSSHAIDLPCRAISVPSYMIARPAGRLAVRLPGFLAGLLVLWATARLAERWAGARAAWPAVLTLFTTCLFWHETGFGRPDALLLGWTTGALALLFWNDDQPAFWKPALAWTFMGLGILTKGPVGLIVPVGAYAAARLSAGEGAMLRKSHWIWGPALALAWPAAWLGLVCLTGAPAGYLHELLIGQNLERAVGGFGHVRPFYYYLTSMAADWMPWMLCLPAAVMALFRDPKRRRLLCRLGGWIGFILLFFSLLPTKRNVYILGATPAFAILIGAAWPDLDAGTSRWARFARGAVTVLLLGIGIVCMALSFWPRLSLHVKSLWHIGLVALVGGVALWREVRWGHPPSFCLLTAVVLLFAEWSVGLFVLPALNPLKTPVALARAVQERLPAERPLLLYAMNDELPAYHSNRRGEVVRTPEELDDAMRREQRGFVVFREHDYENWPTHAPPLADSVHAFRSGSKRYVWLEFNRCKTMNHE
ncbi:MAG: ArnT family glycosyltransferase [Kiritimatiellia bacterium]|jgi:4-amino-4-deoxy-L-arabinose transferase-like glycosyltransferase